jgi:hypothetical protein
MNHPLVQVGWRSSGSLRTGSSKTGYDQDDFVSAMERRTGRQGDHNPEAMRLQPLTAFA